MDNAARTVFTWLDQIRQRPRMYIRHLRELETFIGGYYSALTMHGIIEPVPQMGRHFASWLQYKTGWSFSMGWPHAIENRHPKGDDAILAFFAFMDQYRQLKPTGVCTAKLGPKHSPTGKRVRIGFEGLMAKPDQVDIIRYEPEPLHFLRYHYPDQIVDDELLTTPSGSLKTTLGLAKQWVLDELQVEAKTWKAFPKRATKSKAKTKG